MSSNEEQAQRKYVELQLVMQHVKELNQQMEHAQEQFVETSRLKEYLDDFVHVKKGDDMYASIGPGMFVEGTLKETGKVLVNVGGNVVVYKDVKEAQKLVEKQVNDIQEVLEKMSAELHKVTQHSETVQEEVRKLIG